ncbi:MAG: sigma-70 family RNA polymerase sigma factor [Alkalispirochaeta sp.]
MIDRLYRELHNDIRDFFLRRTGREDVAEDLSQDTFMKVFRRLRSDQSSISNPAAYLYRTAQNVLTDFYRVTRMWEELSEIADVSQQEAGEDEVRTEIAGWMTRFVEHLPEPYRTTLRLSEIEGLPYRDIAEKTGVTVGAVKTRVHRGRKLLRNELTDCCRFSFDARGRVVDYVPMARIQCQETAEAEPCSCASDT